MIETTCTRCGRVFAVKPYRLERSAKLFCSRECRAADGSTYGRQRAPLDLTCPVCGAAFHRKPAERRAVNYCSYECAAQGTGNLKPTPKGERRSPATEFGPRPPHNKTPVGTVRMRRQRGDHDRAWIKVAEPNVWRPRAIVAWELANGPLPAGLVVHHINGDATDDRPENLAALTRQEHITQHRADLR